MAPRLTIKNYQMETSLFTRRVFIAGVLILILTALLITRLAYLQIFEHSRYTTLSLQNQQELIPIEPNRGLIYDRNGVLLAENVPNFSLDIIPDHVPDIPKTLTELRTLFDIDDDAIDQFLKHRRQHRSFEPVSLKLKLTNDEVARFYVNQYRFPGVTINARLLRNYPLGPDLVTALGYVGRINEKELKSIDPANYSASNYIGKIGIEHYYEDELHGIVGYNQVEVNATGQIVRVLKRYPPIPGDNIYLSIDSKLQHVAHQAFEGERGGLVAIDPNTGKVLALVSHPNYDPNLFVSGISNADYQQLREAADKPLYNRAVRGLYPFGSTIKPFYALQGLNENIVSPDTSVFCNGYFSLPGVSREWRDWNHKKGGHGRVTVHEAIMKSCDIYFYTLATKMGITKMDTVLHQFGFGDVTHIDLQEELPGVVASPAWKKKTQHQSWYPGDTVISGIGQGFMLATPLQLANGTAALSKRGVRYQPQLVHKVEKPSGEIIPQPPILQNPVVMKDERSWDVVINAMKDVISSAQGTAYVKFGHPDLYTAAAKTGTAQVYRPPSLSDKKDEEVAEQYRDNSLFIVFAPVENPQIALAVVAENSHAAAKVARAVLDAFFVRTSDE
jgi:penicillin-binding protein 2